MNNTCFACNASLACVTNNVFFGRCKKMQRNILAITGVSVMIVPESFMAVPESCPGWTLVRDVLEECEGMRRLWCERCNVRTKGRMKP